MQSVQDFFNVQNHFFENNDIAAMARRFLLPSAVYVGDAILVFEKINDTIRMISDFRTSLDQANYDFSTVRTIAESLPNRSHLSAWVEWQHYDAADHLISTSTSRYFFERQLDRTLRVQLVEYLQPPTERFLKVWPVGPGKSRYADHCGDHCGDHQLITSSE